MRATPNNLMKALLTLMLVVLYITSSFGQRSFITNWETVTDNESITIPTFTGEIYNYAVDWGDGTIENFNSDASPTHIYATAGSYMVSIDGDFPRIFFNNSGDLLKILSIEQWGDIAWTSMEGAFLGCENVVLNATDTPDLTNVTSMMGMFRGATAFVDNGGAINTWDVSTVTNMVTLFFRASSFNGDLNNWNVSAVTDMQFLFNEASSFNGDISAWNVANVTSMNNMFNQATIFDQDLSNWNVSAVSNFSGMFNNATSFNSNIGRWNVIGATDMSNMFNEATGFGQNLGSWNVSNVTNMINMFNNSSMSTGNYDLTLIGWANLPLLQTGVNLGANGLTYSNSQVSRELLINSFGWTITGDVMESRVPFVTTWETTVDNESIEIPLVSRELYNYTVDWGDGSPVESFTDDVNPNHIYSIAGTYSVSITGNFPRIFFDDVATSLLNIQSVDQWGNIAWSSMQGAFHGCENLEINALDAPDLTSVTSMEQIFRNARTLTADLNTWDVSGITTMEQAFANAISFNGNITAWDMGNVTISASMFAAATVFDQPIGGWDVSSVTDMSGMFGNAEAFNQDIGGWDVGNVMNMSSLFLNTLLFNQDISGWDVSSVTSMNDMFGAAAAFNQDIGGWDVGNVLDMTNMFSFTSLFSQGLNSWDVSSVTSMARMFEGAAFNGNISAWDVSTVTNMSDMFRSAILFNQDISTWDVGNVTDMAGIFNGATAFNSDIGNWDVSNVVIMQGMFSGADSFNQNLDQWDVSTVTNMNSMFTGAITFNGNINLWDVGNVTDMTGMFGNAEAFNQNIGGWDVSSVTDMQSMFLNTNVFNQDLGNWDVSSVTNMSFMFSTSAFNQELSRWDISNVINLEGIFNVTALSTDNYDATLIGWASLPFLQNNVVLGASNSSYCNAQAARNLLTDTFNWSIDDLGLNCTNASMPQGNYAIQFQQGSDNIINIPSGPGFTNELTLEAWVMLDGFTGSNYTIAAWEFPNGSYAQFGFLNDHLGIRLASFDGSLFGVEELIDPNPSTVSITTEFSHVAFSKNGDNYRLYVSGDLVAEGVLTDLGQGTAAIFTLGARNNTNPALSVTIVDQLSGTLDEVRITEAERTAVQINQDIYTMFTTDNNGLNFGYNFNEGVGTILGDINLDSQNGVLANFLDDPWVISNATEFPLTEEITTLSDINDPAVSTNLTIANENGFLDNPEDFITFGHNGESIGNFVASGSSNPDLIRSRSEREYFLQTYNEGTGGTVNMTFTEGPSDPDLTYYLLKKNSEIPLIYEPVDYLSVSILGNDYTFTVPIDSLSNGFYTLGRGTGLPGNALSFVAEDGIIDFVAVQNPPPITNEMTIEAWVNFSSPILGTICSFGGYAVPDRFFRFGVDELSNVFVEYVADIGISERRTTTATIAQGNWAHLAMTKVGDNYSIYINGELVLDNVALLIDATSSTFVLGATDDSNGGNVIDGLNGVLDELRVWDVARTQEDIRDHLFQTLVGDELNLQAYYRFDQPVSFQGFLPDYTGNGRAGTLINFGFNNENSDWVESAALAPIDNAISFDGVDDHIVSTAGIGLADDHSIELWAQNSAIGIQRQSLFLIGSVAAGSVSIQGYLENNLFHVELRDNNGINNRVVQALDTDFSDLAWHHIVYTFDIGTTEIKIYIDGIEQAVSVLVDTGSLADFHLNTQLTLGVGDFSNPVFLEPFQGQMDELRIWNSLLELETIRDFILQDDLTGMSHPNLASLILQYSFNEGSPGLDNTSLMQVSDGSINVNNGDLLDFLLTGFTSNFIESNAFDQTGEISVLGNDVAIPANNVSNLLTDNTNMGVVALGTGTLSAEFKIINTGSGQLNNLLATPITDGLNTFGTFSAQLDRETLNPFDTATLIVDYVPEQVGTFRIFIQVDDGDLNTFLFSVAATAFEDLPGPGNALLLDGANNAVNLGNIYDFEADSTFSIEAWVNYIEPIVVSGFTYPILSKVLSTGSGMGYNLEIVDGFLNMAITDDLGSQLIVTSVDPIPSDSWQHIAMSYDGSTTNTGINLYLNGRQLAVNRTGNIAMASTIRSSEPAFIGLNAFTFNRFNGSIDEVRIWGTELDNVAIRAGLHNTIDPNTVELIGYYRADLFGTTSLNNLVGELGVLEFSQAPFPPFEISNAPLNNAPVYTALDGRDVIWNGGNTLVNSINMILNGTDFLMDEGDRAFIGTDNPSALTDAFNADRLINLSQQVSDKLERNWLINIVDSTELQLGGEILLSFVDQLPDSSRTYYLLKSLDNSSEFEIAKYDGYILNGDSVIFGVDAADLESNVFYSLGRSEKIPGNSLSFDGNNDYVTVDEIGHTELFTYELWVKPEQLEVEQTIFDFTNSAGGGISLFMTNSATFGATATNPAGVSSTILSFSQGIIGEWMHLAVVGDGVNVNLYVNGTLESSGTFVNGTDFRGPLMFGASDGGLNNLEGGMDEFRLWGSARTEVVIQENLGNIIQQNTTGDISGVLVNYRFDQINNSTTLPDLSGTGVFTEGVLNNFNFNAISGWEPSTAFDPIFNQNSLSFDGIDDFVNVPTLPYPNNYTVEAWINATDIGVDQFDLKTIFSWDFPEMGGNTDGLVRLILIEGEVTYVQQIVNSMSSNSSPTGVFIGTDEWHHVAVSNEQNAGGDNTVRIYLDGQLISTLPSELRVTGPQNFNIGAITFSSLNEDFFAGQMDEVRIWDRLLTVDEIRANINREIPEPSSIPELVSYYQFNQGSPGGNNDVAIALSDAQMNHNGLLNGFALTGPMSNYIGSTLFDSFSPGLEVFANGNITPSTNGTIFGFGTRLIGETLNGELVITNTGLDTLNLSSVNLPVEFTQTRGLADNELLPFENDTITFEFNVNAEGITSSEILIQTDFDDLPFVLSYEVEGYPDLPGAGNAYVISTVGDFSSTQEAPSELINQSFSIEYWARRSDNTTQDYVFGHGPEISNTNEQIHVGFRVGDIVTFSFFNNDLDFNWTEANTDWNHFAFTFEYDEIAGTGTRRIFINGLEMAADPVPVAPFVGIGGFFVGQAPFGETFIGGVDELRIWNVTLDEATIRRNLAKKLDNTSLPLDSLVAYYRFDDDAFPFFDDLTGRYDFVTQGEGFRPTSEAPFGDRSLFTYSENGISSEPVGESVLISNITNPAQGVHLYQINDPDALPDDNFPFINIATDGVFGVFAPGDNRFTFSAGLADIPDNPNLRLVTRQNQNDLGWQSASDLFGTNLTTDSVQAFNQSTSEFSLGTLDYSLVQDAGTALTLTSPGVVEFSDGLNNIFGTFTIEYWVRPTGNLGQVIYFEQEIGLSSQPQIVQTGVFNGHLYFFIRESENGMSGLAEGNILINDDEWHHVVYVRDGTALSLYVDGVLDVSVPNALPFDTEIAFTERSVNSRFQGDGQVMDEVRFWNAALSIEELRNFVFTNDLTDHPRRNELFAYYRLDDGIIDPGFSVVDLIGNAHGQLVDATPTTDWVPSGAFQTPLNTVVSLADSGPGSLRDVIDMANQTPEIDTIRFDLPGEGPWIITVNEELLVTDSLVIDATTQPGWDIVSGSVVEIEGGGTTPVGLEVTGDYFELYGLRINNYLNIGLLLNNPNLSGYQIGEIGRGNIFINNGNSGIQINGADDGLIQSNFIGADFDGTEGLNDVGILITADAILNGIGGEANVANVIAFNNVGVQIDGMDALGNQIRQNEISCNISTGIQLTNGANGGILPPAVENVISTTVSGTGTDGQEIDVYLASDPCENNQGAMYQGTVTVTGGVWTFSGLNLTPGNFITVTANTAAEGTSEFSVPTEFFSELDIAALLRIFDDLGGENWSPGVNWLDPVINLSQWDGITVADGRVIGIDLSGRVLSGDFPAFIGEELSALETLNIADNAITALPDLTNLLQLVDFQVQANFLDFGSLEANVGISGIVLSPQNMLLETLNPIENEGDDITLDRTVGGTNNVYLWTKDDEVLDGESNGTLSLSTITFSDDGNYVTSITNEDVPGLTLMTNPIILRVSSLERDELALRAIYEALDGDNWDAADRAGWLVSPVSSNWQGVTVTGNRVVSVDIGANNANGIPSVTFPSDVLDILSLQDLNIANNQIDSIPNLSSLAQLINVDISDNQIQFDDLEANLGQTGLTIGVQTLGDNPEERRIDAGLPETLSVSVAGVNNQYQWTLNGTGIVGATSPTFEIDAVNRQSQGVYVCNVTNSQVAGVTISSSALTIVGIADISGFARIAGTTDQFLESGDIRLLQVQEDAYDTIRVPLALTAGGTYMFEDVPLADYIISADPFDRENLLPTYHIQAIQWDFATVLELNNDTANIDVQVEPVPGVQDQGQGSLMGDVFTDFPDDQGRLEARRRVQRVGCALRRRRGQGRPGRGNGRVEMDDDGFELFSYQTTDDEGQFTFENLPEGTYRLFIEYPGIPINEESFTEFEVGNNPNEDDFEVLVTVFEDGILIEQQNVVNVGDDISDNFTIYPNPAANDLFIKSPIGENVLLEIIDLKGIIVYSARLESKYSEELNRLDITNVASGIYVVRISVQEPSVQQVHIGKLIIEGK